MRARPWQDNHLVGDPFADGAQARIGPASARRVTAITTLAETTSHQRRPLA